MGVDVCTVVTLDIARVTGFCLDNAQNFGFNARELIRNVITLLFIHELRL
jgi:hypothetical protein